MKIEKKRISELRPAEYNPRRLTAKQERDLINSLSEFGMIDPIIINTYEGRENIIIGGHQRVKCWAKLGHKEIDCIEVNLPEERERKLNIRLNANTGEWDLDLLKDYFEIPELEEWGLDLDWEEEDKDEVRGDDYEVSLSDEPITVLGDLYEIGEHRLLCGDSTRSENVEKLMGGQEAVMCVVDPPYNMNYTPYNMNHIGAGGSKDRSRKIINDKMPEREFVEFLTDAFKMCHLALADRGSFYSFYKELGHGSFLEAVRGAGLVYRQVCIWVKNQIVIGYSKYQNMHEPFVFATKGKGYRVWNGGRSKRSVIEAVDYMTDVELRELVKEFLDDFANVDIVREKKPLKNDLHPTMKPIRLLAKLIKNSSNSGNIVIDFFSGSGSTMVASAQLGRRCYGMELDPKYCDVIVERMLAFDPTLSVKRNGVDCKDEFLNKE